MNKLTFHRDLARGKKHEDVVLLKIQKKYPKAYEMKGYCKEYDIFIPELNIGVEVKSDEKSKYTGNILIEVEMPVGTPSALSTTKAKWWVLYDGYSYTWFKTEDIRRCIKENNLKPTTFVGKGDIKEKKAFLIKKDLLYKYKLS